MVSATELEKLAQSMVERAQVLVAAAAIEVRGKPTETDEVVRQMLSRAADLVRGAASLGQDENATSLGVIARALLENLISILWVQMDAAYAKQLQESSVVELARMARVNLNSGNARILNLQTGEDATEEFLASDRFRDLPRRMSVEDRAKQAGVEDLYNVFYRGLSMEVHGHNHGEGENESDIAFMHMQGIGAISMASGHSGVRWLIHRERTNNEDLRALLGLNGHP